MESVALEYTILRLLEFNETEGRATPLRDVDLAAATGSTLGDVRRRLEDLKTREFVELQQVGASYAVTLRYHQPRLRLLAGRLRCFYHVAIVLLTFAFLAPCSARAQSPSAAGDRETRRRPGPRRRTRADAAAAPARLESRRHARRPRVR